MNQSCTNQTQNCLQGMKRIGGGVLATGYHPPHNLLTRASQHTHLLPPCPILQGLNLDGAPVLAVPGNHQGVGITPIELSGRRGRE